MTAIKTHCHIYFLDSRSEEEFSVTFRPQSVTWTRSCGCFVSSSKYCAKNDSQTTSKYRGRKGSISLLVKIVPSTGRVFRENGSPLQTHVRDLI